MKFIFFITKLFLYLHPQTKTTMTEALCYLEIEMESSKFRNSGETKQTVNEAKDFRLAKRLLIMNIYLN